MRPNIKVTMGHHPVGATIIAEHVLRAKVVLTWRSRFRALLDGWVEVEVPVSTSMLPPPDGAVGGEG